MAWGAVGVVGCIAGDTTGVGFIASLEGSNMLPVSHIIVRHEQRQSW